MRWIPRLPGLGEWGRVVDHRRIQLAKLRNVEIVSGLELDAKGALGYGADLIVVATGSRWAADGLSGPTHEPIPGAQAALPHVLTPEQIMVEGKQPPGSRVLVYDCDGYFMGSALAERLAREGRSVTLVTPLSQVAPFTEYTLELPRIKRTLLGLDVRIVTEHVVSSIEPGRASGYHVYAEERTTTWDADAVVLVTCRLSNESLYRELEADPDALAREGIRGVYRIGDCVAPRLIADAVFDGHRLAREIDSADPATPLPHIREYRVLGRSDAEYDAVLDDREGRFVRSTLAGLPVG
jgi:dimethylamine/trimethylamine dehydrogenase